LGVCLGHQAIGAAFGANIIKATTLMHGKVCPITHDGQGLFQYLANPLMVTRYNSLTIDPNSLPDCLTITARDSDDDIMAIRHKTLPIEGVQFHPESILSEQGLTLFQNFLTQNKRASEMKTA
jgi:anthranilate synthase/aminodeoxychorismate synthase-like glutamine amidotransferase